MKRTRRWIALYLGIGIVTILVMLYLSPLDRDIISFNFTLSNRTGFDLTPGSLNFGMMAKGQSSTRDIVITNPYNRPVQVSIHATGEAAQGLIVSENEFNMKPLESKWVSFSLYASSFTEERTYDGEIEITFWRT